ncbi:MAG: DUF1552 domain-containing protein [Fimbriimonadaceae bacterium]|jgi:hypothetical protein|nr:DUF1552 domain-containing protein [Fimbriimonadaceae bacterium]
MSENLSRRTVLKGIGTAVSLPFLEAMMPRSAMASVPKAKAVRMAFLFVPNGIDMANWTPASVGSSYELPAILKPLQPVRGSVNVLTGLAQLKANANGDGPGDHARSTATWLTGVQARKTAGSDIRVGQSIDQLAAQYVGKDSKFASLELGCERSGLAGDCDSGYSCAYTSNVSWRTENTPVAKEVNPRLVFERLFGSGAGSEQAEARAKRDLYRKSVLDFVREDASSLKDRLGARDSQKMEEYFAAIRDVERRLIAFEASSPAVIGAKAPEGIPSTRADHIRLMGDMMILAFQADLTRVCTFMFGNEGQNRPFREIDIHEGHHDLSHHGKDNDKLGKKKKIDLYHVEQLAYILTKMQSIEEGDRTLLDNTMLVYGGGISDGDRHNHDDLPILLCGRGGGALPSGRHMKFSSPTPMTNLFLTMIDHMGMPVERFGDSTGKLQGIF